MADEPRQRGRGRGGMGHGTRALPSHETLPAADPPVGARQAEREAPAAPGDEPRQRGRGRGGRGRGARALPVPEIPLAADPPIGARQAGREAPAAPGAAAPNAFAAMGPEMMANFQAMVQGVVHSAVSATMEAAGVGAPTGGANEEDAEDAVVYVCGKFLKEFKKWDPPSFDASSGNPIEAERWISTLERIFKQMSCPEAHKVMCAVFCFKDDANEWWEAEMEASVNPGFCSFL